MANEVRTYKRGENAWIYAEVKDINGTLVSDIVTVDLYDSAGTQKLTAAAMTETATGKFSYYYAIPSDAALGFWKDTITSTASTIVTKKDSGFIVEA